MNQQALAELEGAGEEVPEAVNIQAQFDAEEAELMAAIEESKALMEAVQIADEAETKMQQK